MDGVTTVISEHYYQTVLQHLVVHVSYAILQHGIQVTSSSGSM